MYRIKMMNALLAVLGTSALAGALFATKWKADATKISAKINNDDSYDDIVKGKRELQVFGPTVGIADGAILKVKIPQKLQTQLQQGHVKSIIIYSNVIKADEINISDNGWADINTSDNDNVGSLGIFIYATN